MPPRKSFSKTGGANKSAIQRSIRSDEEKRAIVAEALAPGANKAAVARKHRISDGSLSKWMKKYGDVSNGKRSPRAHDEETPQSTKEIISAARHRKAFLMAEIERLKADLEELEKAFKLI